MRWNYSGRTRQTALQTQKQLIQISSQDVLYMFQEKKGLCVAGGEPRRDVNPGKAEVTFTQGFIGFYSETNETSLKD